MPILSTYTCVVHTRDLELADDGRVYLLLKDNCVCIGPLEDCDGQLPLLMTGQAELLKSKARDHYTPFHGDPGLLTE